MTLSQKLNDPYFYETPLPRVALMKPKNPVVLEKRGSLSPLPK